MALWREGLLAQAVLAGNTRGYLHHPQLARFRTSRAPRKYIATYLRVVHTEALRRGYQFDSRKTGRTGKLKPILITRGQLAYESLHLRKKLFKRDRSRFNALPRQTVLKPHPLFRVTAGGIADWEIGAGLPPGKTSRIDARGKSRKSRYRKL